MTASETEPLPQAVEHDDWQELGNRGRTTIGTRVVERIAARAAHEVEGIGGSPRRLLGVRVSGEAPERSVPATARVAGGRTSLRVRLSVRYPQPVARTVEQARHHITRRITELTGLAVSRVDVTVTALPGDTERKRTVQ